MMTTTGYRILSVNPATMATEGVNLRSRWGYFHRSFQSAQDARWWFHYSPESDNLPPRGQVWIVGPRGGFHAISRD